VELFLVGAHRDCRFPREAASGVGSGRATAHLDEAKVSNGGAQGEKITLNVENFMSSIKCEERMHGPNNFAALIRQSEHMESLSGRLESGLKMNFYSLQ